MVRPWRSLHRVPGCSDIKLMASAEPSDTPAPLHAIKGDTVSILTRMAILIYPYLLRLGLPTGSLLRTILIRASFILIYWREVSKFQTLVLGLTIRPQLLQPSLVRLQKVVSKTLYNLPAGQKSCWIRASAGQPSGRANTSPRVEGSSTKKRQGAL